MDNPLINLKNKISSLTRTQRKVADYILQYPSEVAFLTVDQLAQIVSTSTTTIMRLTYNLGYSGYSEFQKELQLILRNQTAPHTRFETSLKELDKDDLWGTFINHHIHQIENMMNMINKDSLSLAVDKIIQADNVYCTAVRSGLPVGQYITHGLNRSLGNCEFIIADTSDWIDETINMTQNDLLIAISFPRYAKRIKEFIQASKKLGVTVIVITDSYSSPIVEYSDIAFCGNSTSIAFHNSLVSAMIIADYLISATAIRDTEKTKSRLDKINKLLTDINYH